MKYVCAMSLDIKAHAGKCQVDWEIRVAGYAFFPRLHALTRNVAVVSICAGAIELLHRFTTCLVLVALVGIYAMPLAAAFSSSGMECCTAGMCPRPGRAMTHHQTHEEMPDCAMGEMKGSLRKCEMAACNAQKDNAVNIGLFVLSAPTQILRSAVQVSVFAQAPFVAHPVSQIPETPPPRISLS
jgi:hypothetical protein